MADVIRLLPDHVANQIAAGEVVQRPASVVKELLENAIDAGATQIKLIVKNGGKTLIQVVDNGSGMSDMDARLSFERHATSKITSAEDLFDLHTKGFRGEALASIAAIAHVDVQTRRPANELGTHIRIEGSKVMFQEVVSVPQGTAISVKNLFFNIPARRNFLKSDAVELRHITDEFQRVAMVHPEVSFHFFNNGSEIFNLLQTKHRQRIVQVFGHKMNDKLVPVSEETDVLQLFGFVCKPEYAKKSRGEQFFFANNRFIKSPYLHHGVVAAFEGLLKPNHFPGYFLYLNVPPQSIDINIHPTKTEVKFHDEQTLYAMIRSAVKHSLGQFNVAPVLDFERDANLDTPYAYKEKLAHVPGITVDSNFNPFTESQTKQRSVSVGMPSAKSSARGWETLYESLSNDSEEAFSMVQIESDAETQSSLYSEEETQETGTTFQLRRKYIVCTLKSGLLMVHQNRAHERILYERFLAEITVKQGLSQQLLFPLEIYLNPQEKAVLQEIENSLVQVGFQFEGFAQDTVKVTAVPALIAESKIGMVLDDLISEYKEGSGKAEISEAEVLAEGLARNLAIKTGDILEPDSQSALINDLFGCKEPAVGPFGKKTYTILSDTDLDKRFS